MAPAARVQSSRDGAGRAPAFRRPRVPARLPAPARLPRVPVRPRPGTPRPGNNPFAPSQGMRRPSAARRRRPRPGNNPFAPSQGMPRPQSRPGALRARAPVAPVPPGRVPVAPVRAPA